MIGSPSTDAPEDGDGNQRLALLPAMAIFVLVVDTSPMNVSISAVVNDSRLRATHIQGAGGSGDRGCRAHHALRLVALVLVAIGVWGGE
jgi:hypothetical protein